MTAISKTSGWITAKEYLEEERLSDVRREYVYGHTYAMAGASDNHNRIAGNIFSELHQQLRGKKCEAFMNDMQLKISPDIYYYPDVMVVCDPTDNAQFFRERPTVIFEVLSNTSERIDRREKAIAYREAPSVQTYVIVEQDKVSLTVLHRADDWSRAQLLQAASDVLKLPEIGVEIPLHRIYERTGLTAG